jgi:hypothetical protein
LASGNSTDLYQFSGQAGDQIAINDLSLSGATPYVRLIDPYGGVTYSYNFGYSGTITLPVSGTYHLLVEGQINSNTPSSYGFNVSYLAKGTIAVPTGTALTLGALTSGAISTAGQQNNYVFTITNPTNVYFDSLTNSGSLTWSLTNPLTGRCQQSRLLVFGRLDLWQHFRRQRVSGP